MTIKSRARKVSFRYERGVVEFTTFSSHLFLPLERTDGRTDAFRTALVLYCSWVRCSASKGRLLQVQHHLWRRRRNQSARSLGKVSPVEHHPSIHPEAKGHGEGKYLLKEFYESMK